MKGIVAACGVKEPLGFSDCGLGKDSQHEARWIPAFALMTVVPDQTRNKQPETRNSKNTQPETRSSKNIQPGKRNSKNTQLTIHNLKNPQPSARNPKLPLWRIFFVFLLIMLAGCVVSSQGRGKNPYHSSKKKFGSILQKDKLHHIKRVAVLPFYNLSDRLDAEVIVTNLFINEIMHGNRFSVVKYGDIQEFLWQQKVRSTDTVTKETLKGLADRFSVEGVILGTINTYREWSPDKKDPAIVEISARCVDCQTGQTVWFGREKRTGEDERTVFDFGEIRFCSQLVRMVAKDFLTGI